jgi:TPR repeat protein
MSRKTGRRTLFLALAVLCGATAHADLAGAQKAYAARDFEGAFQQYLEIATLGNVTAQENLAAMYVDGEGVNRDNVLGYAWALIARENGGNPAMQNIIDQLQPHLDDKARARVKAVTDQFGKAALEARLLPGPLDERPNPPADELCPMSKPVNPDDFYPPAAAREQVSGTVFVEGVISPDGRVHRPYVWYSVPEGVFEYAGRAVAWASGFTARQKANQSGHCAIRFKVHFSSKAPVSDAIKDAYEKSRVLAERGDPVAQVMYGLFMFDRVGGNANDSTRWFLKAAQAGVPYAQYLVGIDLLRIDSHASATDKAKGLAWLQLAAANGRPEAKFALASYRLRTDAAATSDVTVFAWLEDAAKAGHRDGTLYLAALLATSPDAARRDPARALTLVEQKKWDFDSDPTALEVMAAANAQNGKSAAALSLQKRAIRAAQRFKWDVAPLRQRLASYEVGTAWTGNLLDP